MSMKSNAVCIVTGTQIFGLFVAGELETPKRQVANEWCDGGGTPSVSYPAHFGGGPPNEAATATKSGFAVIAFTTALASGVATNGAPLITPNTIEKVFDDLLWHRSEFFEE